MSAAPDYEAIWAAIPYPAFVVDENDRFVALNAAAEAFFSMSANSLRRRTVPDLVGADAFLCELMAQVRRGGVTLGRHDVDLALIDQPPAPVTVHASPVHEGAGDVLVIVQPRSLAEQMDRRLTHRSAARSVSGMAAMLAHEIRNPLAGISGAAQLLAGQLSADDQPLAELIEEEARRISSMIDRVDQFGDNRPLQRRPVNIHDVLQRALLSARSGFAGHVRFVEDYDPSLPPTPADADLLMQLFLNLLKNAAEAAPKVGGVITLRTSYRPGVRLTLPGAGGEGLPLQVVVSDNGPGVPAELRGHIFDPFVSSKANGRGLGLALVSKIVSDHGGAIECESEPGHTSFRLLLPVWSEKERAA